MKGNRTISSSGQAEQLQQNDGVWREGCEVKVVDERWEKKKVQKLEGQKKCLELKKGRGAAAAAFVATET